MDTRPSLTSQRQRRRRAFTLIELLVVIAIIAILAAILFPVFAQVREQARQSSTMSNLHAVYVGARTYAEDEGHYPTSLFGYAETPTGAAPPMPVARPAVSGDPITPMDQATGNFSISLSPAYSSVNRGFLYREQVKDYVTFLCPDNPVKNKTATTIAYWPLNSPISIAAGGTPSNPIPVTWTATDTTTSPPTYGDTDLPGAAYVGKPKLFYVMDSMDIGPMLDSNGKQLTVNGQPAYELHYSPDWSHRLGATNDYDASLGHARVTQLKYKNPPADRTILTYVTEHAATAHDDKIIILLLSGTTRKMNVTDAYKQLPLNYIP